MKKAFSILLKIIMAILTVGVTLIIALMLIVHSAYTVKPSVRQLEKAAGVKFPAFTITEKDVNVGSCHNYDYTVQFKTMPGPEVFERIEYLCKYGNVIEDPLTGEIENPWSGENGYYTFNVHNLDDHAGYRLPFNVRWMSLRVRKDSDLMYIRYSLDD